MTKHSPLRVPVDRLTRVNELLKREIADIIELRSLNHDGVLVSITKVECATSLKTAKVFISILGAEPDSEREREVMRELVRLRPEIQENMARHVVLKYTPVLHFEYDRNIAEGDRVLQMIREMEDADENK